MRRLVLHAAAALLLAGPYAGGAQTRSVKRSPALVQVDPAKAGMSAERLARIDAMLESAVKSNRIPGAVALIARHGRIVYHKAFGMADNATGRLMKPDDIFRIASQTKAITATAVLMLWEEGKFQLDDPVSKFIPEFRDAKVLKTYNEADGSWTGEPVKRPITIRDLLTHTSGLGYGFIDADPRFRAMYAKAGIVDAWTTEPVTIQENVRRLARLPLHHHPGEKFTYAEGLDVCGALIEIVSGMTFAEFLQKRLFEPIGMTDTAFYLPGDKASRLVSVQHPVNGRWQRIPSVPYDPDYPIKGAKTFFAGGAGLSSTAKDYATFLQMLLNGGEINGVRILSRTTVRTMLSQQVPGEQFGGTDSYFSLAFGVLTERGQAKGGSGSAGTFQWGGYFNTQYFADPKEGIVAVLMKQTQGANDDTAGRFSLLVGTAIDD
jgi:CubicO group peptidase (beta-lactamase class C family)